MMEIEKLKGEKLLSVQFYYDGNNLSGPISLFKDEIEKRLFEYQEQSNGKITYKVALDNVTITKDNIAYYYEFMSDEDLKENKDILSPIFANRYKDIKQFLAKEGLIFNTPQGVDADILHDNYNSRTFSENTVTYYYEVSYFGVKDTLKPIDEYINEIKNSEAYKQVLSLPINEEKTKLQQQAQFEQVMYILKDATDWAILTIAKDFEIIGDRDTIINHIAQILSKEGYKDFEESDKYLQSMVLTHNENVKTTPEINAEIQEFGLKSVSVDECLAKIEAKESQQKTKTPSL